MELRAYQYRCRRCGGLMTESELAGEPELIEETILLIAIPDKDDWQNFLEDHPEVVSGDVHIEKDANAMALHDCGDGGFGIADIAGCTDKYIEEDPPEIKER